MKVSIILLLIFQSFPILAAPSSSENVQDDLKSNISFWEGEWYFSWGYNRDYWQPSDIHVSQPALGNDFTIHNVRAEDFPQWNSGIFDKGITEPQYSLRIGHFFDKNKMFAIEFNYDHTKYSSYIDQNARITGKIHNNSVDMVKLLDYNYFHYNLHNGANHIMFNFVTRLPIFKETNQTLNLSGLLKAGIGIMLPHSENMIMGNSNDVGSKELKNYVGYKSGWWQLNGWTTGVEVGFRFNIYYPIYIEFTDKETYSMLYNIPVYQGTAEQSLWMNELIFSVGFTYDNLSKV